MPATFRPEIEFRNRNTKNGTLLIWRTPCLFREVLPARFRFAFRAKLSDPSRHNVIYNILILDAVRPRPCPPNPLTRTREYHADGRKSCLRCCWNRPRVYLHDFFPPALYNRAATVAPVMVPGANARIK